METAAARPAPDSEPKDAGAPAPTDPDELPGDSVCWLRMVCQECGSMAEGAPAANCPQCGAPLDAGR